MTTTGSVRYRASVKRGVSYPCFRAQIFDPTTKKQIQKEYSINKFGAKKAKKLANQALNEMRKDLLRAGCDVSFQDLNNPPRTTLKV